MSSKPHLIVIGLDCAHDCFDYPLDRQALVQSGKWMVGAAPHDAEAGPESQEERSAEKGFAGWNFLKKALKRLSH